MTRPLLEVRDLRVDFHTDHGVAHAVRGISFDVQAGEALGLVGESGCGKSVTALSLLRLLPTPPAAIDPDSSVTFRGEQILQAGPRLLRTIRGAGIGMIFQEPMTSLNPVLTIGEQVAETIRVHEGGSRAAVRDRVIQLLERVGIPDASSRYGSYPHQLSGGLRQRVMIAIALACGPDLLIADEPTTALDVTIQAQILDLLADLQSELGMAMLFISHDLAVVSRVADRVAVMYAGRIVEEGCVPELFHRPSHPYTQGLLAALPRVDRREAQLASIPGRVPDARQTPPGCLFAPRCADVMERCRIHEPPFFEVGRGGARCWLAEPSP